MNLTYILDPLSCDAV